jgi:macrolide-specific efflux system membrane fusion protein
MTQMTAQVFFVSAEAKNAVLVPVGALRPAGGKAGQRRPGNGTTETAAVDPRTSLTNGPAVVRVTKADGTIESRDVRVGIASRVSAQIVSGLDPGERIVVGQRTPVPAPAARPATGNRPLMPRV